MMMLSAARCTIIVTARALWLLLVVLRLIGCGRFISHLRYAWYHAVRNYDVLGHLSLRI